MPERTTVRPENNAGTRRVGPSTAHAQPFPKRQLDPARVLTGRERRRIDPNNGLIKLVERNADMLVSRFIYPNLGRFWNPYDWLLRRRFSVAAGTVNAVGWPGRIDSLRALFVSDIHTGSFLKPATLASIVERLMEMNPDLVAIGGDIVTGHSDEVHPYLDAMAPLAAAPLGAWYCFGNHDYFAGETRRLRTDLDSIGIRTLENESVVVTHGAGQFVLGGIDDLILGRPDWNRLVEPHGPPHLLLAHNPDHFYEAVARGVPLTLSGHTHGGQIRFPKRGPIIRQSRFCLDEGVYRFGGSTLVVSRGLGSVGIPWRWGADPEAMMLEIRPGSDPD